MQHTGGVPLPPPHGPVDPATGWAPHHQAHHPGPPPGAPGERTAPHPGAPYPPAAHQPGPVPPPPPGTPAAPGDPAAPPAPPRAPAPGWTAPPPAPPHPGHAPAAPAPSDATGVTGHQHLPPAAPVAAPPTPPAGPGTGGATLAVLLIGPAGAGKTTVARHWASNRPVPTAHISLDDVREWVRSGFADPQTGWNEHSEAQYRLARRTCGFAARNFLANGVSCILDDAVFPDRPVVGLGGWKRHVGPGLLPVVLLPGLDVVLERNAERSGNRRLSDEEVAGIHGRMAGWYGSGLPIIDNSAWDVETTARALDDVLARAMASPPSW
ncbi:ATP-binding protein [Streptomyces sp. LP05-1]|uniref:ATP-binding protein n=1 Tax=Streptomyces pyxinae TaxID=2970734 RepID=A0ABT2CQJ8_9ACTN|nr:ATP-binding protein [Streptomyces sp. LP05-1]MCS0639714.1 ATP-binding protein [Streptomyces sp. LP05-1]